MKVTFAQNIFAAREDAIDKLNHEGVLAEEDFHAIYIAKDEEVYVFEDESGDLMVFEDGRSVSKESFLDWIKRGIIK